MSETAETVIEVRHLRAGYPGRVLLEDANFSVRRGEIFVILGGSGSGKSTVLKHMIGLHPPLGGDILIEGIDLTRAMGTDRQQVLNRIGVMYQSGALFGSMTLLENIMLPQEEFTDLPVTARETLARSKLSMVGLDAAADLYPAEISGGMAKRAAIARAMALEPGILFLDEPSAGLDPITSADLDATIISLSRNLGVTFVVVTHELASIYAIADRCIMLDGNRKAIIAEGKPTELRDHSEDPWVRQFFQRQASAT